MKEAVAKTALDNPRIPVHSCHEGKVYRTAQSVRWNIVVENN